MSKELETLEEFLNMSVFSTDEVFAKFQTDNGGEILNINGQKCYYKPGTRNDKILLIAHADTVWDKRYSNFTNYIFDENEKSKKTSKPKRKKLEQKPIKQSKSLFYSGSEDIGLGADDRAGAAICYLLKDTGNSILITDKEEIGAVGARSIMDDKKFREIIRNHRYILQFDLRGNKQFKCYNVGSMDFKAMLEIKTKYDMLPNFSFTDVAVLGKDVCGANFSVGYYHEHTPDEFLVKDEWLNTLKIARKLAKARHQQFYTDPDFNMKLEQQKFRKFMGNRKRESQEMENFEVFDNISFAERKYGNYSNYVKNQDNNETSFDDEKGIDLE